MTTTENYNKKPVELLAPSKIIINTKLFSCITENGVTYNTKTLNQYKANSISQCCDFCGTNLLLINERREMAH